MTTPFRTDLAETGPVDDPVCVCGHPGEEHGRPLDTVEWCEWCDCPTFTDRADAGSATTELLALFLFTLGIGLALLAFVSLGRGVMCDAHDDAISYCPGYTTGSQQ